MQLLQRQNTITEPLARRFAQALQKWGEDLLKLNPAEFRGLSSLISAMQQGEDLKAIAPGLVTNALTTQNYPATSPLVALRAAVNSVWETNILPGGLNFSDRPTIFSPDRRWLLTLSGNFSGRSRQINELHLYDLINQKQTDIKVDASGVEFTGDSQRLVIQVSGGVRLYNITTGQLTDVNLGEGFARLSADGRFLVNQTFGATPTTQLYDLTGKLLVQYPGGFRAFRPRRSQLFISEEQGDQSRTVLYDLTGKRVGSVEGFFQRVSPDGAFVAVALDTRDQSQVVIYELATQNRQVFSGSFNNFSPDSSRFLISDFQTNQTTLYSVFGQKITQLSGNSGRFSPSGKLVVATTFTDGSAQTALYDGVLIRQLEGSVQSISLDEKTVLSDLQSNMSRLYDISTNETTSVDIAGRFFSVFDDFLSRFSPSGQFVATIIDATQEVALYNLAGNLVTRLSGESPVFSQDGHWLVTEDRKGTVHLYDLTLPTGSFTGFAPSFSPDSRTLVLSQFQRDRSFSLLFDLSGKVLTQLKGRALQYSPDGQLILTAAPDNGLGQVRLYAASGQLVAEPAGVSGQFTPDGQVILVEQNDGMGAWINRQGEILGQFTGSNPRFSPTGKQVVATVFPSDTNPQSQSILYDVATRRELARFDAQNPNFSPDGKFLSVQTFSSDNGVSSILIQDLTNFQQVAMVPGSDIIFSHDSQTLVVSIFSDDDKSQVVLYSLTGQEKTRLTGFAPRFSPNSQQLMIRSAVNQPRLHLYDLTGRPLAEFAGIDANFSPDGQRIIVDLQSEISQSLLYDIAGNLIVPLRGRFLFSRDRQSFVTTTRDRTLFYDWSGLLLAEFPGFANFFPGRDGSVESEGPISPDGQYLLTDWSQDFNNRDDQLRLWRIDAGLDDLLAQGCKKLSAYFETHPELRQVVQNCAVKGQN
jgi:Tol biopolymer transport system component